jgi:predicted porin
MRVSIYSAVSSLAAIGLPSLAGAGDPDVYGRLNVTLQNSDEASGEHVELRNNASRLGVKGELELSSSLKAIYQLEFGVNVDGDSDEDTVTHRNQFVGLEGAFGTIKVGRHDTALKEAQGDFDLFDDLEGDIAGVFNGENRLRNYVGYLTPTFGKGFNVRVNFFPGEEPGNGDDGLADGASMSLDYESESVYVAIAHDRDLDGENVQTTRLVGGYTRGPAQMMLLYQQTETEAGKRDGVGASLAWTFGKYIAKFQYLDADQWRSGLPAEPLGDWYESLWSVGVDRELGEDTRLLGFFTSGDIGRTAERNSYIAVGIEHDF